MGLAFFILLGLLTIFAIVFVYEGQRRIPVQYAVGCAATAGMAAARRTSRCA